MKKQRELVSSRDPMAFTSDLYHYLSYKAAAVHSCLKMCFYSLILLLWLEYLQQKFQAFKF